jgi:hypothetical protein
MNGVAVPKATQGSANGSVTLTTANPPSIEKMYELGVIGTKHVPEELMLNDLSSMFEMGTGRLLIKDGVGGTAKTVLEGIDYHLANTLIVFDSATVEVLFRWQNSLLGQLVGRNYNEGFQRY